MVTLALAAALATTLVEPALPPAENLRLGMPVACSIREIKVGHADDPIDWTTGTYRLVVGKKAILLKPSQGYRWIVDAKLGRDGSVMVTQQMDSEGRPCADFIRFRDGREEAASFGIARYWDAKNYVGGYCAEVGTWPFFMREVAPTVAVVIGGRRQDLGPGDVSKVWGLTEVLASIPVDDQGRPSGDEFRTGSFLRVYRSGKTFEIGHWEFLGETRDHSLVLDRSGMVAVWKDGAFRHVWRLPEPWRAEAANSKGDVLLRRDHRLMGDPEALPVPDGPLKMDDAVSWMLKDAKDSDDATTRAERDWSAAMITNGVLRQLAFKKPKDAEQLLWRNTTAFADDFRLSFHAFYGDIDRDYEVRPHRPRDGRPKRDSGSLG